MSEIIHLAGSEDPREIQECVVCGKMLSAHGELFTPGSRVKELGGPGDLNFAEIVVGGKPTCTPTSLGGALVKLTYTGDGQRTRSPVLDLVVLLAGILLILALILSGG